MAKARRKARRSRPTISGLAVYLHGSGDVERVGESPFELAIEQVLTQQRSANREQYDKLLSCLDGPLVVEPASQYTPRTSHGSVERALIRCLDKVLASGCWPAEAEAIEHGAVKIRPLPAELAPARELWDPARVKQELDHAKQQVRRFIKEVTDLSHAESAANEALRRIADEFAMTAAALAKPALGSVASKVADADPTASEWIDDCLVRIAEFEDRPIPDENPVRPLGPAEFFDEFDGQKEFVPPIVLRLKMQLWLASISPEYFVAIADHDARYDAKRTFAAGVQKRTKELECRVACPDCGLPANFECSRQGTSLDGQFKFIHWVKAESEGATDSGAKQRSRRVPHALSTLVPRISLISANRSSSLGDRQQ